MSKESIGRPPPPHTSKAGQAERMAKQAGVKRNEEIRKEFGQEALGNMEDSSREFHRALQQRALSIKANEQLSSEEKAEVMTSFLETARNFSKNMGQRESAQNLNSNQNEIALKGATALMSPEAGRQEVEDGREMIEALKARGIESPD